MVDDMSTSLQSPSSAATAAAYDVSNAADGVLLYKQQPQQQQQQYAISSVSQRFRPSYLVAYGSDNVALSSTMSSADHDLNRGIVQQQVLPDRHYGPGMTDVNSSLSGRRSLDHHSDDGPGMTGSSLSSRRLREFIPQDKKDSDYWMKRQKNNEAAKRSRDKRRINDVVMTKKIVELTLENKRLRLELETIKRKYGLLPPDIPLSVNRDIPSDRTRSPPLCVGICSSDDGKSSSPSSFPLHQPVPGQSSPSPPVLDRCYTEPLMNQHHPNPEGKSSLPSLTPLTPQHYQSLESYRSLPAVSNQRLVLQNNVNMPGLLFQQSVHQSSKIPDSDETIITKIRHQQPHATTSTLTTAKVSYLQLENFEDPVSNTGCTQQVFNSSKIRSSNLTEDVYSPSRSISLAPVNNINNNNNNNNIDLAQGYFQLPRPVKISNSEIPLLALSYLSSDDEDGDTRYGKLLSSPEVPLNLTTRSLSWHQSPATKYLLSDSRCGAMMREPATVSLENDAQSVRTAPYRPNELPRHELWTSDYKHSMENYTVSSSRTLQQQQQQQQECLRSSRDSDVKTTPLFEHQSPLSTLNAKADADSTVTLHDMTRASYLSVAARRQKVGVYGNACSYEGGRYASTVSSDLAAADDGDDFDVDDNAAQNNSSRQVRGGVPLKVWHKRSLQSAAAASGRDQVRKKKKKKKQVFQETAAVATTSPAIGFAYDDCDGRLVVDESPDSSPSSDSMVNYSSESSNSDATTAATSSQQNNGSNTVARKCNRKKRLTGLSLTAATILESENNKLKEELRCLSRDVTDLKEIIGRKENDICSGNSVLASI